MSKITVPATKLKVKDRIEIGGVSFRIVNLNKSFGRKKSKNSCMGHDNVRISLRSRDESDIFTSIGVPGDTELTVNRK